MNKVASINEKLKRSNTIENLRSNQVEKVVFQFKRGQVAVAMAQIPKDKKFDMMQSRYMEVHDKKIAELLGHEEKQEILSRYLRMKNKIGLNYMKPEIEGLA